MKLQTQDGLRCGVGCVGCDDILTQRVEETEDETQAAIITNVKDTETKPMIKKRVIASLNEENNEDDGVESVDEETKYECKCN